MNSTTQHKIFEGGCQCGKVRYQVTGEPLTLFACHCKDCQRQSSSAFGMALWVRLGSAELLNGRLRDWVRITPSGNQMLCQFCEECGTRIFHRLLDQPDVLSIKPGTLDDTKNLSPVGHLWVSGVQHWLSPAIQGVCFTGNPDHGFNQLFQAWLLQQNNESSIAGNSANEGS